MISADTMIRIASRLESMSDDACLGHNDVRMTPQAADALAKCIKDYVREPERPTCEFKPSYGPDLMGNVSLVECTACAWTIEPWNAYEFRYCPMCGAEVLDEDSAN